MTDRDDVRLLDVLRQEAPTLPEAELPTADEVRGLVGALCKALQRAGLDVEALRAPVEPVSEVTATAPVSSRPPVASVSDTPAAPSSEPNPDLVVSPTPPEQHQGQVEQTAGDPDAIAADTTNSISPTADPSVPLSEAERELLARLQARDRDNTDNDEQPQP